MKVTKTSLFLLLIFVLALVLRVIAAAHVDIGPDEMIYSTIALNIISAGRLGTVEQSPLYFYIADLGHKFFGGITPISARFPGIIFGSFTVFIAFLIAVELFESKKAGLMAAFLYAVSGYAIRYNYEMDPAAFFFSLLAVYFFLRALKENKTMDWALMALFFGVGAMIKNIILLFLPAIFIVWMFLLIKKKDFSCKIFKPVVVASLVFIVVISPIFIYNYLLYKDRGVTDYYFSNILGVGETVHEGVQSKSWSFEILSKVIQKKLQQFFFFDGLLFVFGIFGIYFSFIKNKKATSLLLLTLFFLIAYLAGQTGSNTHYLWLPIVLSIFGGYFLFFISEKVLVRFSFRHFFSIAIAFILFISFFLSWDVIKGKSSILELREYVNEEIPEDAIVVIDPRVYRGIHAWVFNDRHYLEGTQFPELSKVLDEYNGPTIEVPIYYVECGKGTTCLWSTEDYERVSKFGDELTSSFKENTRQVAVVTGRNAEAGNTHTFNIYKGAIRTPSGLGDIIDKAHIFYFYPVGWKYPENAVDNYNVEGFEKVLSGFGFLILYLEVFLAVLSLPFVLYTLRKQGSDASGNGNSGESHSAVKETAKLA